MMCRRRSNRLYDPVQRIPTQSSRSVLASIGMAGSRSSLRLRDEPDGWLVLHAMIAPNKVLKRSRSREIVQMSRYKAVNGAAFTDEDIERWAAEAESEQSYTGRHLGPAVPRRPVSVGADARPFTVRLDAHQPGQARQCRPGARHYFFSAHARSHRLTVGRADQRGLTRSRDAWSMALHFVRGRRCTPSARGVQQVIGQTITGCLAADLQQVAGVSMKPFVLSTDRVPGGYRD